MTFEITQQAQMNTQVFLYVLAFSLLLLAYYMTKGAGK